MRMFDPRDVSVVVDGEDLVGFAEGTFVSTEKEEDTWGYHVGAQGDVTRARNAHPIGTITVTLEQTSPSNRTLNRLSRQRETFPAEVVSRQENNVTIGGSKCWIQKPADFEFQGGGETSSIEWVIVVADYEQKIEA